MNEKLFYQGETNFLKNKEAAERLRKTKNDKIKELPDGTFSIIYLVISPVQPGQKEWVG